MRWSLSMSENDDLSRCWIVRIVMCGMILDQFYCHEPEVLIHFEGIVPVKTIMRNYCEVGWVLNIVCQKWSSRWPCVLRMICYQFFTVRGYKNSYRNPYELRQSSPLYRRSNTPKKNGKNNTKKPCFFLLICFIMCGCRTHVVFCQRKANRQSNSSSHRFLSWITNSAHGSATSNSGPNKYLRKMPLS